MVTAFQAVVTDTAFESVVTIATANGVVAFAAEQAVVTGRTGEGVIERITVTDSITCCGQRQFFDVFRENGGGQAADDFVGIVCRVVACFIDDVVDVVNDIAIIAGTADKGVGAGAAVERIVAGRPNKGVAAAEAAQVVVTAVAIDCVGKAVAAGGNARRIREDEALDIGCQGVGGQASFDSIVPLIDAFNHSVVCRVDQVIIATGAADHAVVASAACQAVVAAIAEQGIVARSTRQGIEAAATGKPVGTVVAYPRGVVTGEEAEVLKRRSECVTRQRSANFVVGVSV